MELLHATARTSVQWMFYCLTEGTLLALFAWVLVRLLPRQNSGTRFALWFSVLLGTIVLPFLAGAFFRTADGTFASSVGSNHSLLTFSDSLAFTIFIVWGAIAAIGLLRVIAGLWQVNRIRRNSEEVDPRTLHPATRTSIESFPRALSLRLSDEVQTAAAIGFFKPAVLIPRWFLKEIPPAELEQVLLHELTHLRRRDDWTNLVQKIIRAFLFFHPSVWWLEQRLALEREMACDEAVLARWASPHGYAQCLTRLAEKTLVKKRMALAQGIVNRMQQLSLRVAQILDANRPSSTRIWKPAVPMVVAVAALCGFSAWSTPVLVSFHDKMPVVGHSDSGPTFGRLNADLRSTDPQPKLTLTDATLQHSPSQHQAVLRAATPTQGPSIHGTPGSPTRPASRAGLRMTKLKFDVIPKAANRPQAQPSGDYVVRSEQVIVTMSSDPRVGPAMVWQVSMWRIRIPAPAGSHADKTISRNNI